MNRKWIVPLLGVVFVVSVIMNINQYREHVRYTEYVSEDLNNKVSQLTGAILSNVEVFSEIKEKGSISLEQAQILNGNFHDITFGFQDIEYIGHRLKNENLSVAPAKQMMSRNNLFGNSMIDSLEGKDERELLESEKILIENYLQLMQKYEGVIKQHVPGASADGITNDDFYENSIKKDFWIKLIEGIARETVNVY